MEALASALKEASGEASVQAVLEAFQVDLVTGLQEVVLATAAVAAWATCHQVQLDTSVELADQLGFQAWRVACCHLLELLQRLALAPMDLGCMAPAQAVAGA